MWQRLIKAALGLRGRFLKTFGMDETKACYDNNGGQLVYFFWILSGVSYIDATKTIHVACVVQVHNWKTRIHILVPKVPLENQTYWDHFFFCHIWHCARTLFRGVFACIDPDLDYEVEFGAFQKLGDPSTKRQVICGLIRNDQVKVE